MTSEINYVIAGRRSEPPDHHWNGSRELVGGDGSTPTAAHSKIRHSTVGHVLAKQKKKTDSAEL